MRRTLAELGVRTVLVVDDQSPVRTYTRMILERAGVETVVEASSGDEALALVAAPGAHFDLIFCDLHMPDMDGIEMIRAFAAMQVRSWLAILSVEEDRVREAAAMLTRSQGLRLLGAVEKPLSEEKFLGLVDTMRRTAESARPRQKLVTADEVEPAFRRREFRMAYQPQVDARTGSVVGVEALVRWQHSTRGSLDAGAFVPVIEAQEDQLAMLTDFSIRESVAWAGRWAARGRTMRLAINVPASAFDSLTFPDQLEATCREQQVDPTLVTVEITETQIARDPIRMLDVAARLRLRGFHLSVDDFGTGHSSLSQLQRLPVTEIKLDRQFVHGAHASPVQRAVVDASLSLARNLKLATVAEGVESREDWELFRSLGCSAIQGFYLARPMLEDGLDLWWKQFTARDAPQ